MPAKILLPPRDRHHLCRVPTDDLPRSAVAIVFRHHVKLRPAKREARPPKSGTNRRGDPSPRYSTRDHASLTAAAAVSDAPAAMDAIAVLLWEWQ
jgi:hypothetical protein